MDSKKIFSVLRIPLCFVGGLIFSFPYTGGSFSPFAAPFAAAADGIYSVIAAAGSITGIFLFHTGLTSFRYFAITLTSAATLSIVLRAFRLENEKLMRILCPTACCFAVNFIFLLSQKFSPDLFFSVVCETAMCGLSVPVFTEAKKQLHSRAFLQNGCEKSFICLILAVLLAAAHLRCAGAAGTFASFFIFFFAIAVFSHIKGFEGGVITGVCCSFVAAMSGDADFSCIMFSMCGCLCSFFSYPKRIYKATVMFACSAASCAFGEYTDFFPIVPACAAAGILYCLIPKKIFEIKENSKEENPNEKVRRSVCKSGSIAAAVASISDCLSAAHRALEPMAAPQLEAELIRAKNGVCRECDICESCINEIKKDESPCYKKIAEALAEGTADLSCLPQNFSVTCRHSEKMLEEMKKAYFIYCTNVSAVSRINRMQKITGSQFKAFGGIIGQACESAETGAVDSKYDYACAAAAKDFGAEIKDARLCTDRAGRDYFDLSFVKTQNDFSITALTEKLAGDTGYQLSAPTVIQNGDVCDLVFRQKEKLSFSIAAAVRPSTGNGVCGDYYRCFKDSFSRQTVLLSDGMGTGKRAAVDSAFTCETFSSLIKSGLDEKAAADAVNCAMMIKSPDESFSTIDFLRLDPVLKTAEIYKCGAAPTFILHGKSVTVIETESSPVGILDSVNMSSDSFEIEAGDLILIVSDGVSGERYNWILSELKSQKNRSANAAARHILQCAADRKIGKRADDMTVIAVCIAET